MKKQNALLATLTGLLLVTLLISGCRSILVTRNGDAETGETETRQYNITEFTRVDIGSAFVYEIEQSDTYRISITAPENLFDDIKVAKEGQTLKIEKENPWTPFNIGSERLRAVITMPRLHGLDSSGATKGVVTHFSSTDGLDIGVSGASAVELVAIAAGDIKFNVSGASEVTGALQAEDIDLDISGASSIHLEGAADDINAEASGASRLNLTEFTINNADVTFSGASSGSINLNGRLDIELSGASRLEYLGEPLLGEMNISGASTLKRK